MSIDPWALDATLLSIIIALLAFIGKRLNKLLEKLLSEVELSKKRHDISDVVLSTILKDSFSSKGIAQDKTPWPKIFNGRGKDV